MTAGCGTGTTSQNVLVAHEFAVVLAKCARFSSVSGVGRVGTACPFPNVAEHLVQSFSRFVRWDIGRYNNWMEELGIDEIAFDRTTQRRSLPFKLRGRRAPAQLAYASASK